ncbi:hypothetical protein SAY87_001432 [Trapa incisa]|uniref:Cytochrome b561 and DOMON domain-containing protein n=1 Tax=Trapa incisa TaxID=236973 RepID=A0AAN7GGS4_9MYRT|nr:hypothetical protein SAY87_001432 [Trapa incisa]
MKRAGVCYLLPLLLFSIPLFFTPASSQSCSSYKFSSNNVYKSCVDLPVLSSFLHWNFNQSTATADIAFRVTGTSSSRWISWAINPSSTGMVGCQALVAYVGSTGSVHAYTSPINSYRTSMPEGSLSFGVPSISGAFQNGEMTIFAKLQLAAGTTTVNQVWQEGPMNGANPGTHSTSGANMRSMETLSFATGSTPVSGGSSGGGRSGGDDDGDGDDDDGYGSPGSSSSSGSSFFSNRQQKKNVHGLLNAVSWGIMMPLGAIFARHLKVFEGANPAWFYLHITCQGLAYILGIAGWVTGLRLGDEGGETGYHGAIGAILFIGATLQVFALLVRPKPDHKYRFFWNIYHHSIGYTVISLSILNVFKGLQLLNPASVWKQGYIAILIILGLIAAVLEVVTWSIVIKRRRRAAMDPPPKHPSIVGGNGHSDSQLHYGA